MAAAEARRLWGTSACKLAGHAALEPRDGFAAYAVKLSPQAQL